MHIIIELLNAFFMQSQAYLKLRELNLILYLVISNLHQIDISNLCQIDIIMRIRLMKTDSKKLMNKETMYTFF